MMTSFCWRCNPNLEVLVRHPSFLTAALLTGLLFSSACSNEQFNAVNQSLVGVNKLGQLMGGGDARIPTAAVSAALGALEMIKAFSADPGESSGLISAGGQSYHLLQLGRREPLRPSTTEVTARIMERGVDASVTYRSEVSGTTARTEIKRFFGRSQGYYIDLSGSFEYQAAGALPSVACEMKGELDSGGKYTVEVKELKFRTTDPLPRDGELGSLVMASQVRTRETETVVMSMPGGSVAAPRIRSVLHNLEYTAQLSVKEGKIVAEATYTKNGEPQEGKLVFGENIRPDLGNRIF
ncbi:MAG: hypothetical protein VKN33_06425 [Candidatus Sericytochromatia bacterium]|nr:hypothetical protein [Candidatus Sericytochromatia bacterium]